MATVEEINAWLDRADEAESDANGLRWQAAEGLWQAQRPGSNRMTQRQIEKELNRPGFSQTNISFYTRIWRDWGDKPTDQRPTFTEAYAQIKANDDSKKGHKPKPGGRGSNGKGNGKGKGKSDKGGSDYQGNQGESEYIDPDWPPLAPLFASAIELLTNNAEHIAEVVPDRQADELRRWTDVCPHWVEMLRKALDSRLVDDDPIMPE